METQNKYVVAYFSLHTGELLQELVLATSPFEAAKKYLDWDGPEKDLLSLQTAIGDDNWINVLELKDSAVTSFFDRYSFLPKFAPVQ